MEFNHRAAILSLSDVIQRHISSRLLEALADSSVVLLHGARQTGKSAFVQHVAG